MYGGHGKRNYPGQRRMAQRFLCSCKQCQSSTSKKYASEHNGLCKRCAEPEQTSNDTPTREQRILDHGYQAYAREEGHYDQGDY